MIRRPPRSTLSSSSAASDVYKRQLNTFRRDTPGINTQVTALQRGYLRRSEPGDHSRNIKATRRGPELNSPRSPCRAARSGLEMGSGGHEPLTFELGQALLSVSPAAGTGGDLQIP